MTISWAAIVTLLLLLSLANAIHFDVPSINIDTIGQLGFAGTFAGFSDYSDSNQFESIDPSLSSFVTESNGIYTLSTSIDGEIFATCQMSNSSDIYFAGQFAIANNTALKNIARFDISSQTILPVGNGVDGPVYALFCQSDSVYVGGNFKAPIGVQNDTLLSYGGSTAIWNTNGSWAPVPWKGFNGPVYTITQNTKRNSIVFGGYFDATGDGQYFNPISSQPVNLGEPTVISAGNGMSSGSMSNPSSIICPKNVLSPTSNNPWLLEDDMPGYWDALFDYSIQPSMFRISNVKKQDRGTKTFNIISLGSNRLFTLSYIDPVTHKTATCSESCPLSNDANIEYQDFTVTNKHKITTAGIRLNIDSWHGLGGGLDAIQIFQSDIDVHPLSTGNTGSQCTNEPSAHNTATGDWKSTFAYGSYQTYLTSSFPTSNISSANVSITYYPNIPAQGLYKVYANTPGCVSTSTCDQRTQVDLTLQLLPGNTTTVTVDQAVTEDTKTLIYDGFISTSSAGFQPTIELHVAHNATAPDSQLTTVIADSISFDRNQTGLILASILEYQPNVVTTNVTKAWHPLADQLPIGSIVTSIDASSGDVLYIGGEFQNQNGTYRNIVSYDYRLNTTGLLVPLASIGLNGQVNATLLTGNAVYIGGSFNATVNGSTTLRNIAKYDTINKSWSSIGNGIDGPVQYLISQTNGTLVLSGDFKHTEYSNGTKQTLFKNAVLDVNTGTWSQRTSLIVGKIISSYAVPNNVNLLVGQIQGAQTYQSTSVGSYGNNNAWSTAILNDNSTIHTGAFWQSNSTGSSQNTSVLLLGGEMLAGNAVLAVYPDGTLEPVGQLQGTVLSLLVVGNQLYIGGQFNGSIGGSAVSNFAIFDLVNKSNIDVSYVYGESGNAPIIRAITLRSNDHVVYVGGSISSVGSLKCNSVCSLDTQTRQWNQVAAGIAGDVSSLEFDGENLLAAGNFTINGVPTLVAKTDTTSNSWSSVLTAQNSSIGKPPSALLSGKNNQVIIAGNGADNSTYLGTWDGTSFTSINNPQLGPTSIISQLLYMPIATSPSLSRFPTDTNSMLFVAGQLNIPNYGNASAALYDGTSWYPFILSTTFNGSIGGIQHIFTQNPCCTINDIQHYLPVPAVILISIGISLGLMFVIVGMGLLGIYLRRRNGVVDAPEPMANWQPSSKPVGSTSLPDAALVGSLGVGAAAANNLHNDMHQNIPAEAAGIAGVGAAAAASLPISDEGDAAHPTLPFETLYNTALLNSTQAPEAAATDSNPQLFYAKNRFETQEWGELDFDQGSPIVVTDMSDKDWWMGYKDDGTGNAISGVFPSYFVEPAPVNRI